MTTLSEILIPYRPDRNPDTTPVEEVFTNPEAGTNCELLVHAIVSARGFELPNLDLPIYMKTLHIQDR